MGQKNSPDRLRLVQEAAEAVLANFFRVRWEAARRLKKLVFFQKCTGGLGGLPVPLGGFRDLWGGSMPSCGPWGPSWGPKGPMWGPWGPMWAHVALREGTSGAVHTRFHAVGMWEVQLTPAVKLTSDKGMQAENGGVMGMLEVIEQV